MAEPARYDLTINQGALLYEPFALYEDDDTPRDLTGYTPRAQIRARAGAPGAPIFDLTPHMYIEDIPVDGGATVSGVVLRVPGDLTATIDRAGHWDLFLDHNTDSARDEKLLYGTVTINRAVTRG